MEEVIRPVLHPAATRLLRQHQEKGDLIAIITATNRFVTEPIAAALACRTCWQRSRNAMQVVISRANCPASRLRAKEKSHLHHWLAAQNKQLSDFASSHFYSDSHNDIPLLDVVTHPVATNPNAKLQQYAAAKGWPQITLFDKQ
jgi:phosphoserine phosphatase